MAPPGNGIAGTEGEETAVELMLSVAMVLGVAGVLLGVPFLLLWMQRPRVVTNAEIAERAVIERAAFLARPP